MCSSMWLWTGYAQLPCRFRMLDPRIYRAALVPVLLALIVGAFSLSDRPRPIGTTLAPDAFDGARARADARPGRVGRRLPGAGARATAATRPWRARLGRRASARWAPTRSARRRFEAETVDGKRRPDHGHRAPGRPARARARGRRPPRRRRPRRARRAVGHRGACSSSPAWSRGGRLKRTVTFVSTSGGSGGLRRARATSPQRLGGRPDAVLVLGDLAGTTGAPAVRGRLVRRATASAPLQLRRTVEAAVRKEAGTNPGGARATSQWARLAFPVTRRRAGPARGRRPAGRAACRSAASARRRPDDPHRAQAAAGLRPRGAAHAHRARQHARRSAAPADAVPWSRCARSCPLWAVRLLVAALLLAPMLVAVDGFARVRRRHEPVGPWLWWIVASAAPVALALAFAWMFRRSQEGTGC